MNWSAHRLFVSFWEVHRSYSYVVLILELFDQAKKAVNERKERRGAKRKMPTRAARKKQYDVERWSPSDSEYSSIISYQ